MSKLVFLVIAVTLLVSCRSAEPARGARVTGSAWTPEFDPPGELVTARVRLEPLAPKHTELDYAAAMGSREHLLRTLHWGDWPRADFTVQENRKDLERHWSEFERHEAYAYTVMSPDRERVVGCIYLNPDKPKTGSVDDRRAKLAWWVIESELSTELDRHLLESVLAWIQRDFPIDTVAFPVHRENARGVQLLTDLGLSEQAATDPDRRTFLWRRG
jgi:RimJ/RimL family protein N-acetyltransferase